MNESRTPLDQAQEEILNTVRKSQAAVIEAIQAWASAVRSITPSLPDVNVPLADKMPKPQDLVASAYDFARASVGQPAEVRRGCHEGDHAAAPG